MNLDQELRAGKSVCFFKQDDVVQMVVAEESEEVKSACPIDFVNFPNLVQVLDLDYLVYMRYSTVYNVKLIKNRKKVIATFNANQCLEALRRLDKGVELYFERKGNEYVRR